VFKAIPAESRPISVCSPAEQESEGMEGCQRGNLTIRVPRSIYCAIYHSIYETVLVFLVVGLWIQVRRCSGLGRFMGPSACAYRSSVRVSRLY